MTRLKYVPDAANDPSLSEVERTKAAEFAKGVAVTTLSRIWQMLLRAFRKRKARHGRQGPPRWC